MLNTRDLADTKRKLPNGWRWVRLMDLLTSLETGTRPEGGAVGITEGVPSLSAEHMTMFGTFEFSSLRFVPREFYEQMSRGHIEQDDILIVKDGATTGKVALIDDRFSFQQAVINDHVFLCRPHGSIVFPRYLFLWLWGPDGQSAIRLNYQGAAIGGINQRFAESVLVPLPSLPEQKRLAAILDKQMAAVTQARAAAEAQLAAAKVLPAAYLRAVFNSPEAQHWPRRRLGEVCDLLPSKSITTNGDTVVQAITTACLTESGFQPSGIKQARMWATDAAECVVSPGEILIARSNTPELVGRVAMFNGVPNGVVATDLTIRVWPSNGVNSLFLTAYLSYLYLTGYWKERAGGASGSMKKITRGQIQNEQVPVPPLSDQKRITAILNDQMMAVERVRKALVEQLDTINKLPAALLRRAFEGKI